MVRFWLAGTWRLPGGSRFGFFDFRGCRWLAEPEFLSLEYGVRFAQVVPGHKFVHAEAVQEADRVQGVSLSYPVYIRIPDRPLGTVSDRGLYRLRGAGPQQAQQQQPAACHPVFTRG